jgi:hypothetical protein
VGREAPRRELRRRWPRSGFDDKQREKVYLAVGEGYRESLAGHAAQGNLDL